VGSLIRVKGHASPAIVLAINFGGEILVKFTDSESVDTIALYEIDTMARNMFMETAFSNHSSSSENLDYI
jgi:hypothetical protein